MHAPSGSRRAEPDRTSLPIPSASFLRFNAPARKYAGSYHAHVGEEEELLLQYQQEKEVRSMQQHEGVGERISCNVQS